MTARDTIVALRLDPGLQAERTALAWRRTSLAMTAIALLLLRVGIRSDTPLQCLGLACLLLALATFALPSQIGGAPPQDSHRERIQHTGVRVTTLATVVIVLGATVGAHATAQLFTTAQ